MQSKSCDGFGWCDHDGNWVDDEKNLNRQTMKF